MSVYKKVRKNWLKQLNKKQKKQYKGYVQDVADKMLEYYAEAIRLGFPMSKCSGHYMPIDETNIGMRIYIETTKTYKEH